MLGVLHEEMKHDCRGTLEKVAAIGYTILNIEYPMARTFLHSKSF